MATFQEVKQVFIEIYGDQSSNLFTDDELKFDEAFRKAWNSVDSFDGNDAESIAEEMASFSYLTYSN
jgi:hypothetical protein